MLPETKQQPTINNVKTNPQGSRNLYQQNQNFLPVFIMQMACEVTQYKISKLWITAHHIRQQVETWARACFSMYTVIILKFT